MAKRVFLDATDRWAERLCGAGQPTVDLRADRARRSDLVTAIGAGPGVVLYAGHGRPRGWAGYQALRIGHLEFGRDDPRHAPAGLVTAFACSTLDRSTDRVPFGQLLVDRGIARAYLAPAGPVVTSDADELADLVIDALCVAVIRGEPFSVADLVMHLDREVDGSAATAWSTFDLVGDGSTRIV